MTFCSSVVRRVRQLVNAGALGLFVLVMAVGLRPGAAHGAEPGEDIRGKGPWRGQIVDADTKQPLEGVVVLAIWNERFGSVGGLAGGGYFDSEEVVTDADGRFTIRRRKTSFNPLSAITGPEFTIFKPGYGAWRFQGSEAWPSIDEEQMRRAQEAWGRFSGEGAVLAMPPLRTKEERSKALVGLTPSVDVPREQIQRLLQLIDQEREALGLQRIYPKR